MSGMTSRLMPESLAASRTFAVLPTLDVASAIAPIEVMIQESITTLCVPADAVDALGEIAPMFADRATFGVWNAGERVDEALDAGATFCWLERPDADLVAHLSERGVPAIVPALTPTEVSLAWQTGASAVVITPADALGVSYATWLRTYAADVRVVAAGGLTPYTARTWLERGALAIGMDDATIGDAFSGGSLASFRERVAKFSDFGHEFGAFEASD